ncbi:MAG: beta-ketoacyl-[acyl-carrier-protein] synthase family protein [Chitinophagales bacterium]|nr:beta-ketoacyl-[acyl-carrier-protein] synthase family protein [Chitinophagales bacterium]
MQPRVVITGMGIIAPGASNINQFNCNLKNGVSPISFQNELERLNFNCHVAAVANIDKTEHLPLLEQYGLEKSCDAIKMTIIAGLAAWRDAQLPIIDKENMTEPDWDTGLIMGSIWSAIDYITSPLVSMVNEGQTRKLGSQSIPTSMHTGSTAYLSGILGLGNKCYALSTACASGLDALLEGYHIICRGDAKRMLVGGVESPSPYIWAGFDSLKALVKNFNNEPHKASRPLSASARGFVPGSGAGILVLESLESALQRNAPIYAEVLGGAANTGGQVNNGSMTMPNYGAVKRCIAKALEKTKIQPNEIDFINGHLTATKADPYEIGTWASFYDKSHFPYINSTKSMVGHCLGAAGAIETIATILQLSEGYIHPSLNSEDLHPEIEKYISHKVIPQKMIIKPGMKIAAKCAFGFGDINSCVLFKKYN